MPMVLRGEDIQKLEELVLSVIQMYNINVYMTRSVASSLDINNDDRLKPTFKLMNRFKRESSERESGLRLVLNS